MSLQKVHATPQGSLYLEQNHTTDGGTCYHSYLSLNCERIGSFRCYDKTYRSVGESFQHMLYLFNLLNTYESDSRNSIRLFV